MTQTIPQQTEAILEALEINSLAPEEQEELLIDLGELVTRGTLLRLIEQMDEKTQDAFLELLDSDPEEEEVGEFLKKYVPGADAAVEETIAELQSDILSVTS